MKRVMIWCITLAAWGFMASSALVHAQAGAHDYPTRNLRLIVPFGAGGGPDATGRQVAQGLSERTMRNVIVDNRPGASGLIGMAELARANADGHTVGLVSLSQAVIQAMAANPPVNIAHDLAPVAHLFRQYTVLIVRPDSPAKSVRDLLQLLREKPGFHGYASGGNGTPAHLAAELFLRANKVQARHIPYKGMTAGVTDIIRGDVLFACSVTSNVATLIQGGRLKALGLLAPKRISTFPDVPAFAELGLPDVDVTSWAGIAAPRATPPALRQRLAALLRATVEDPVHAKAFTALGLEIAYLPAEPFDAVIQSEAARWARFVKETGLRID
jgi:tripartite-type tricarboxylate transporter receptor subunit TctC